MAHADGCAGILTPHICALTSPDDEVASSVVRPQTDAFRRGMFCLPVLGGSINAYHILTYPPQRTLFYPDGRHEFFPGMIFGRQVFEMTPTFI